MNIIARIQLNSDGTWNNLPDPKRKMKKTSPKKKGIIKGKKR